MLWSSLALVAALVGSSREMQPSKEAGAPVRESTLNALGSGPDKSLGGAKEMPLGDLVFRAPLIPGGTDALPATITINGVTKEPLCRYRAKDATATSWPAWGYGETLTKVEVGADTTDEDLPHLGRGEKGRKFNGADYYESATVNNCQIGTEDLVVEVVIRGGSGAGYRHYAGQTAHGGTTGFFVYSESTVTGRAGAALITGSVTTFVEDAAVGMTLVHQLFGVDRSYASATYGGRIYSNGGVVSTADFSARAGSIDSALKFALGAASGGTSSTASIEYLAVWKQSDWLPGTAANATILDALAADRSARFWGTREEVNGIAPTSLATGPRCAWTPSNKLDCYSASAPITGADMPPGQGSLGSVDLGGGLLVHAQISQPLLQARALNTTWTAVGAGTVATSTTTPFVDARQTYQVVDNDGAGEEYIYQDIDITALATGSKINVCPWAATESGTQLYTVTVTEQTGGTCTTTSTHYKPTATTSWALAPQTHTVLDGDCTSARIELRPYDVASGAAATGAVTAMVNAFTGSSNINGCLPVFVDTAAAAITATAGSLRYPTTYSAALGGRQVADVGSVILGRRTFAQRFAFPFADVALSRSANDSADVFGMCESNFAAFAHNGSARRVSVYDSGYKWLCGETRAHTGFVPAGISVDYARDLYTTWFNGNTCQSSTAATATLDACSQAYTYVGSYTNPANSNNITGMLIRDIEVYR